MNPQMENKRTKKHWPKGLGMTQQIVVSEKQARSKFPPIQFIDKETGEVYQTYQYKVILFWRQEFTKNPEKPFYEYPDYLVIMEHWRKYGNNREKVTRFRNMLKGFILSKEDRCKEIKVYDNTGVVNGNLIYHVVLDQITFKWEFICNMIFPERPKFIPHPKFII